MGVDELAIQANEKGEADHDTFHDITLTDDRLRIRKLSRLNDIELDVELGTEQVKTLHPGDRTKRTLATSDGQGHVQIESTMATTKGVARVTDIKTLKYETLPGGESRSIYVQQLTITSEKTKMMNSTTRYFVPFYGEIGPTALTARGNKNNKK